MSGYFLFFLGIILSVAWPGINRVIREGHGRSATYHVEDRRGLKWTMCLYLMNKKFHVSILPKPQLDIWKKLTERRSSLVESGFYLAGGTALALHNQLPQKYGPTFNPLLSIRALASSQDVDPEIPALLDHSLSDSWQETIQRELKRLS